MFFCFFGKGELISLVKRFSREFFVTSTDFVSMNLLQAGGCDVGGRFIAVMTSHPES